MRINSLELTNYRQLKELYIDFEKKSEHDLHIFIGTNGSGKSNILNAINWCLYFEEPHLHDQSMALPLLNLKLIKESNIGDMKSVRVQIKAQTDDGVDIIYNRESWFRIVDIESPPFLMETKFEVSITGTDGDTKYFEDEEANEYVRRFVPNGIREYFFFDGERLDKYFTSSTSGKVKDSIFEISQVQLLETMEKRLSTIHEELRRETTKNSPDLDKLNNEYEVLKNQYLDIEKDINECKDQIVISRTIIEKCTEYLRGLPDVQDLEERREGLKKNMDFKEGLLKIKRIEEQDNLREYSKLTYLYSSIKGMVKIIDEKKTNNQLPPNIDNNILKTIINEQHCIVCDRDLNTESNDYIISLINKITMSSETSNTLIQMEPILRKYLDKISKYKGNTIIIGKEIKNYRNDISQIRNELEDISKKLGGYKDKETIKDEHRQREIHEKLLDDNKKNEGRLEERKGETSKKRDHKKKELDRAIDGSTIKVQINKERLFCEQAIEILSTIKNSIMEENRMKIESETEKTFLSLIWKKNTFKNVIIKDDYSLSLKHKDDYECLGSCSAAEKALLALSFTLSLHKVSGFHSPLVIDTPISRVSDANRSNFAKVLADVSQDKQIILLFTQSEYSEEISILFDIICSTKNILNPNTEEVTTIKEV